jgi:hypothetical protein
MMTDRELRDRVREVDGVILQYITAAVAARCATIAQEKADECAADKDWVGQATAFAVGASIGREFGVPLGMRVRNLTQEAG